MLDLLAYAASHRGEKKSGGAKGYILGFRPYLNFQFTNSGIARI